jgi:hypothetical protein
MISEKLQSEKTWNVTTKRNILTAICSYLRHTKKVKAYNKSKYTMLLDTFNTEIENHYNLQIKNKKEEDNFLTQEELHEYTLLYKDVYDKFIDGGSQASLKDLVSIQKYLIILLYTRLPPMRLDFAMTKIINEDIIGDDISVNSQIEQFCDTDNSVCNIINLKDNIFYLVKYKTKKTYGMKKILLDNETIDVIKLYIKHREYVLSDTTPYLLLNLNNKRGEGLSKNSLTKTLNRIFGKNISVSLLRKSYISEKYPVTHNFNEMQKDAYIMGHSVDTQQRIYRKK